MKSIKYLLIMFVILSPLISSCAKAIPKKYETNNVDGIEVFYYRYSMIEPYKWAENEFWLSKEQRDEIYFQLSELKFKSTDKHITHADLTSLDKIVIMLWNYEHTGLDYHFYDGNIYYENNKKTYVAEDKNAIISTLRRWTAERFPELNKGDF